MTRSAESHALQGAALERSDLVARVYDSYAGELYGYLVRVSGNGDSAEDLLQETFLRLVREVRGGRAPDQPRPWLYRVATNLAASRGRRLSVLGRALRRLPPVDPVPSPEQGVLGSETGDALMAALAHLTPDARRGLLLAAQGLTGPEIAKAMGRSELATRSVLCRARRALREALARMEADR